MKHKCFVLVFCLIATPAFGAAGDEIHMYGAGNKPCVAWTKNRVNKDRVNEEIAMQWVNGFFSGYQPNGLESFKTRQDAEIVWDYIDVYCKDHPLDTISSAVIDLLPKLRDNALKEPSKK